MFTIYRIAFVAIALLLCIQGEGQVKTLSAGDAIPDLRFTNVLNYSSSELQLSKLESKFIILEFWSPSCVACLQSFPSIDSLQAVFKGVVQFILVNKESKDATMLFFAKRKSITMPSVPFITGDSTLSSMLPREGYPYSVWIDADRKINYITAGYNVTNSNVNDFIAKRKLNIREVDKAIFNGNLFDFEKKVQTIAPSYYCYISRCIEGLNVSNNERSRINDSTIRISASCQSIAALYKKAYREYNRYKFNSHESLVLYVSDSSKYLPPKDKSKYDEWAAANSYNFDMILSSAKNDEAYKIMQQQLFFYFGLKVSVYQRCIDNKVIDVLQLQE